jgi:hypothetical protein
MAIKINELDGFPKVYVVTWSKSQNCYHYDQIEDMLSKNWDVFYGVNPNASDWIVVGFADTPREANLTISSMKRKKAFFLKHGRMPDS